ncbi:MAG: regulator [Nocardioides sp.]|nr:regulator [Nocardioides sp.]
MTAAHLPDPALLLTPRELDIIARITRGNSNWEICEDLGISMNILQTHIRAAYLTMGVRSRSQAVMWALSHGIAPTS